MAAPYFFTVLIENVNQLDDMLTLGLLTIGRTQNGEWKMDHFNIWTLHSKTFNQSTHPTSHPAILPLQSADNSQTIFVSNWKSFDVLIDFI